MTAKNNLATLYDAYNSLTVADQTVLQALSVLYHPASAVLTASCLGAAGCRESHLRAFSPQNVAVRLARLTKAGLTRESVSEGKNSTKLWNCKNGIGEIAIRHAIRDGRFMPLAKAALAETRGRDWRGDGADDSPLRRLRIHFHVGNFDGVERDFAALAEEEPGQGARFLGQLISLQPDDSWRQNADNKSLAPMTAAALADAVKGLVNPGPIESLAKELLAGKNPDPVLDPVAAGLADIAALQGKPNSVSKLADYAAREETRLAIKLGAAMVEADADTLDLAETALASRRSRLGGREHLLPGLAGVWHALAVSVADSPDAVGTMMKRIASPAGRNHEHAAALACIGYALQFLEGQSHSARAIPDFPPADDAITALCHALAMLRIEPGRAKDLVEELKDQAARARAGGYRWLAAQLAAVCEATQGGYDPAAAASAWKPLAAAFISHDEWRRSLKALDELAVETPTAEPAPKKRLAWLVNQADHPANPFAPLTLQPVEQSIGKDGQWSKGRNIALRRIYQRASDVDAATMQDRRLFMALDIEYDGMGQGYRFNVDDALPDLVGHPLVFRGDSGGAKLEVVAGDLELSVGDREGGCEIGLEPALTDFFAGDPDEDEPDRHIDLPDTAARFETPTRLRVYRFGEKEKKLIQAIGDGLTVPASGRAEAIRTLSNLAGRVRIQSDIPELAGEGEIVDSDPRPRFHIMPQNPGLKVEAWAHPLGDEGPAYRPGRGGKVISAEVDGGIVRTSRNLKSEKELTRDAVVACASLSGHEEGDLSWRLDDPETALSFLAETEELGEKAVPVWPKGGRFRVRKSRGVSSLNLRISTASEWFEVEGGLRVDEHLVLDMNTLLAALHAAPGRFIPLGDGDYLALTDELKRQLADLEAFGERHGSGLRIPALAGTVLEGLEESGAELVADAEWRIQLERRKALADFQPDPPANFRAELRPYQLDGFRWMARLAELGAGACLADDMGLGKTVQALALLVRRASLGPALVVAPTSVCHNWSAEAAKFAPTLNFSAFGDGDRAARVEGLATGDVLITSYALLRQEEALFADKEWATVVLDEAQAIKNIAAKRSRAAMSLKAAFRLITTGTPIENHLSELWSLFRFINPRLLGSWRKFHERFAAPIEKLADAEAGQRLRRILRPFILRRTKAQVLDSLPPKTEITLAVELDAKERAFYESLRRGALERLETQPGGQEGKRFQILAEIMRLRRACCSPELISGDVRVHSAKQAEFHRIVADLVENGHKALVFSQFVDHLGIIRRHLDNVGISYQYLDGSTPAKRRKQAVEDFQNGRGDVFLISLKAGGLGLNLTAADFVIHMDPWWNPAVEDQASDRAHRIGQDKPVTVYRLVAAGTIEEKIVELHRNKRDLADNLLSGTDQAASMDLDEMMRLLREE